MPGDGKFGKNKRHGGRVAGTKQFLTMEERIKEFENRAIEAVSRLCDELGTTCIEMSIRVDNYEKSCRTNATFFKSIPADASHVPGCGPACKAD